MIEKNAKGVFSMCRYALLDDQWVRIKDMLPRRKGTVGVTAKDNRLLLMTHPTKNNFLYPLKT